MPGSTSNSQPSTQQQQQQAAPQSNNIFNNFLQGPSPPAAAVRSLAPYIRSLTHTLQSKSSASTTSPPIPKNDVNCLHMSARGHQSALPRPSSQYSAGQYKGRDAISVSVWTAAFWSSIHVAFLASACKMDMCCEGGNSVLKCSFPLWILLKPAVRHAIYV